MKAVAPPPAAAPERPLGITIHYRDIADRSLGAALDKLDEFTQWQDVKDIHRYNKFRNTFDGHKKKATTWYMKLVDRHAVMEPQFRFDKETEKRIPVLHPKTGKQLKKPKWAPTPGGQTDIVMKDRDAFEKDAATFHSYRFDVKVPRFWSDDLIKAGLTPAELRSCSFMLADIPEDLELEDIDDEAILDDVPDELKGIVDIEPEDDDDPQPVETPPAPPTEENAPDGGRSDDAD